MGEEEEKEMEKGRKSKDKKLDKEGRKLVELVEERGWEIFNGSIEGDREGEFTYTGGKGSTVIDYIIGDRETREKVKRMRVGDRIDSDHHPLEMWIEGKRRGGKRGRGKRGGGKKGRGIWNEEGKKKFKEKIEAWEGKEEEGIEEEWVGMEGRIKEVLLEVEKEMEGGKMERSGWWDEECVKKKKVVRRKLREWRRNEGDGEEYRKEKREYKELCERKKKVENDRWERRAEEAKKESEVWEIINKERKWRRRVGEGIEMVEWKEYFMRLTGGVEEKVVRGRRRKGGNEKEGDEEEEISVGEIKKMMKKIKDGKAAGIDGVPAEVWKYGGEKMEEWLWKFCNRVWKGEGWPEAWKEGLIVPILKKGEGERVEDYRGVTLMATAYKMYAMILAERLREEIEEKGLLADNQAGFRKGMGTIDNIYVLNYLVNRQVGKKGRKMVVMFVDLKAAFDSVDRGVLIEAMRGRGVREGLIRRVGEIMRETRSKVRVGGEVGEDFWTIRGVRQGCPLSPLLFNIVMADLEEELGKIRWGGVELEGRKWYSLVYADDVVLMAEDEDGMRSMLERLEGYLEGKKLELNTEKTKILRFRKGGGRLGKRKWRWKGKVIEEVKEYKYLGYVFQRNGGRKVRSGKG